MKREIIIRSEKDSDVDAITDVTVAAFKTLEISNHTEQFIIEALRTAKALIREGLSRLRDMNAQGCCLVGHPEYYRQFRFTNAPELVFENVPPEVFFALSFDRHTPQGTVTFHDGFKADGQQGAAADG